MGICTSDYDEMIEFKINEAMCLMNIDERIQALESINVDNDSIYNDIIFNYIINEKLKIRW